MLNSMDKTEINTKQIYLAIVDSSISSAEKIRSHINYENEKEKADLYVYIIFEFIYLLIHLTSREFFKKYGDERRKVEINKIGGIIINTMVKTMFKNLSENFQDKMYKNILNKLNDFEIQYSKCTQIINTDVPLSDNAVVSLFGKHISNLTNNPKDLTITLESMSLAMEAWDKTRKLI